MGNEALPCKWNSFWITPSAHRYTYTLFYLCLQEEQQLVEETSAELLVQEERDSWASWWRSASQERVHAQITSIKHLNVIYDVYVMHEKGLAGVLWYYVETPAGCEPIVVSKLPHHNEILVKVIVFLFFPNWNLCFVDSLDSAQKTVNPGQRNVYFKGGENTGFSYPSKPSYNDCQRWGLIILHLGLINLGKVQYSLMLTQR